MHCIACAGMVQKHHYALCDVLLCSWMYVCYTIYPIKGRIVSSDSRQWIEPIEDYP